MKKWFFVLALVAIAGCVGGTGEKKIDTSSPSGTTTSYVTAITECRFEEAIQYYPSVVMSKMEKEAKKNYGRTLEEQIRRDEQECKEQILKKLGKEEEAIDTWQKTGKIKDFRIEILSEGQPTPEEEKFLRTKWNLKAGKIVEVKYETFFAGDSRKDSVYLVNEFGAWKILA